MLFELEKSKFNFQIVTNLMQIQFSMKYHSLIYMIVCNLSWHWKLIHIYFADIMVNKCAAVTCKSGYASNNGKSITKFNFPMQNTNLLEKWARFVNRQGWSPSVHSVLCELHFKEELIKS